MRNTIIIIGILLLVCSCSVSSPDITGKIENLPDGTPVYLHLYDGVLHTVDSTVSTGGEFGFAMPKITPTILYIRIGDRNSSLIPLFVEGIPVEIAGDITLPHRIRAEGSESNEHLAAYRISIEDLEIKLRAIEIAMEQLDTLPEELSIKRDSIGFLLTAKKVAFISENNSSIVAAFLASTMIDSTTSRNRINHLISLLDTTSMTDNIFLRRLRSAVAATQ